MKSYFTDAIGGSRLGCGTAEPLLEAARQAFAWRVAFSCNQPHNAVYSFSYGRGGRSYCYYVAGSLDPLRTKDDRPMRFPAAPLERMVLMTLGRILQRNATIADARQLVAAVELRDRSIHLVLKTDKLLEPFEPLRSATDRLQPLALPDRVVVDRDQLRLIVDRQPAFRGGKATGSRAAGSADCDGIALLRTAHRLLDEHSMSPLNPGSHTRARAPSWQRQRRVMVLGLLAPQLQKAILQGTFTGSVDALLSEPLPLAWADSKGQRTLVGQ